MPDAAPAELAPAAPSAFNPLVYLGPQSSWLDTTPQNVSTPAPSAPTQYYSMPSFTMPTYTVPKKSNPLVPVAIAGAVLILGAIWLGSSD